MSGSTLSIASPSLARPADPAARRPSFGLRVAAAIGACIDIGLLVAINAFPQAVGVVAVSLDRPITFIPLVGPGFSQSLLVFLDVALALGLTLNLLHLGLGRRTLATRWADVGLSLYVCAILWLVATREPLLGARLEETLRSTTELEWHFSAGARLGVRAAVWAVYWLAFWIAALVTAVKSVSALLWTARRRAAPSD